MTTVRTFSFPDGAWLSCRGLVYQAQTADDGGTSLVYRSSVGSVDMPAAKTATARLARGCLSVFEDKNGVPAVYHAGRLESCGTPEASERALKLDSVLNVVDAAALLCGNDSQDEAGRSAALAFVEKFLDSVRASPAFAALSPYRDALDRRLDELRHVVSPRNLIVPQKFAGRVWVASPGRMLYRVAPDGTLAPWGFSSIRLHRDAANSPRLFFDSGTALNGKEQTALSVRNESFRGFTRVHEVVAKPAFAVPESYNGAKPDPALHVRVAGRHAGRIVTGSSSGAVYFVTPGGFLQSWTQGVFLSHSVLRSHPGLNFTDVSDPESVILPVSPPILS